MTSTTRHSISGDTRKHSLTSATCYSGKTVVLVALLLDPMAAIAQAEKTTKFHNSVDHQADNRSDPRHGRPGSGVRTSGHVSLDGYGNNQQNHAQGTSGELYRRLSPAHYTDGLNSMNDGPELRYISNRIFADHSQNLFSENSVTQWVYNWGQFIDHTIALRESGSESTEVSFDESDPLELFTNSSENLTITRSAIAADSGIDSPREHVNTISSYIDAWAIYGGSHSRLEWLREGPVDGDISNNKAKLLLTESGHLPTASIRADATTAPSMERVGMLATRPDADDVVIVAGDVRANENIALTTVQTLFAREHNRIVDLLPNRLTEQRKFDIARRIVIATQQYITYNEFLPAVGVFLDEPSGYKPDVDTTVSHEFATVGYRAHSMIHGEIEMAVPANRFSTAELEAFAASGIEIEEGADELELAVPLNIAFANPQLVASLGLGPISAGLGSEPQYKNDETIDNQLRSVLFQIPNPDSEDPDACLDGPTLPQCFLLASDVGVLDVFRARDHGIADYNTLREAYSLSRIESFAELTGEDSEEFPNDDPEINSDDPINDPSIMDYIELRDIDGNLLELGSEAADGEAVTGIRRSTLAARLKAIYGTVDQVDAFVGMVSEQHLIGSELGELQHAMWKTQFEALRDGDSSFYLWNVSLHRMLRQLRGSGLTYQQTLTDIIVNNTDIADGDIQDNMFLASEE